MKILFLFILICLVTGCSTTPPIQSDDFQVQYHWATGSLPPPYYYSYTITLGPKNVGKIEFQPNYAYEDTPLWVEEFEVTNAQLEQIFSNLSEVGVFSRGWKQSGDVPTGGSSDNLTVINAGEEYKVPSYVADKQASSDIGEVYDLISSLVPKATWEDLLARHDQYVLEYEDQE